MKALKIEGNKKLKGDVLIDGAKNSCVALLPCALLSEGIISFRNVPDILDIRWLLEIIQTLGVECHSYDGELILNTKKSFNRIIDHENVNKYRGSYYFMGALLAKYQKVTILMPGGCKIGKRPIDFHLDGFKALGARVSYEGDLIILETNQLIGAIIDLPKPSVGATINLMIAASKALGKTIINNAASEVEVDDVLNFMRSLGLNIYRDQSSIVVNGIQKSIKKDVFYTVMPDRIEAATYIIMGLLVGDIIVRNCNYKYLKTVINTLISAGAKLEVNDNSIKVYKSNLKAIDVLIKEYPHFPTDVQQPLTTLLALAQGTSTIKETIFENRFSNCEQLNKMGANICVVDQKIIIEGVKSLKGTRVVADDLRGAASLVLAGLVAEGTTIVENIDFMERGYTHFLYKLRKIGANVTLIDLI